MEATGYVFKMSISIVIIKYEIYYVFKEKKAK